MSHTIPALLAAALALPIPLARAAEPVRIGLAAPLSGSDAGFGQGMRQGAEQAVADLNRGGGIDGRKIQLVVQDDAGDPAKAPALARKFAEAGVTLVVGHLNSGVTAAALPAYDEAGIVAVTPGATWAPLTARGAWNVFRVCGSVAQQGALAGEWLARQFPARPVAVLHDKSPFGRGLADDASRALKARGGREALFEGFGRGEKDASALVARMKAARVEAVYFGGLHTEAAVLVRAMREGGLGAPLVGSDGLLDKDFPNLAGPGAEGTLMTLAPEPRRHADGRGSIRNPVAAQPARGSEAEMFAAQGYAAVEVLKQAVEAVKGTDARKVAAFLHAGKPLRTAIGEIAFDTKGDLMRQPYVIAAWRRTPDGRLDYAGNEVPY